MSNVLGAELRLTKPDCVHLGTATLVSEAGFKTKKMKKKTFPEWGLPVARPKEGEWPGMTRVQHHPGAAGATITLGAETVVLQSGRREHRMSGGQRSSRKVTPREPRPLPGTCIPPFVCRLSFPRDRRGCPCALAVHWSRPRRAAESAAEAATQGLVQHAIITGSARPIRLR